MEGLELRDKVTRIYLPKEAVGKYCYLIIVDPQEIENTAHLIDILYTDQYYSISMLEVGKAHENAGRIFPHHKFVGKKAVIILTKEEVKQ